MSSLTLNELEDKVNAWIHKIHAKVVNTQLQTVVGPERDVLTFLEDGRPAAVAPAKDFSHLIPMSAKPLSPFEPVLLIKVGDVLVSNRAIAVGFSWEDLEQYGHYSFHNVLKE